MRKWLMLASLLFFIQGFGQDLAKVTIKPEKILYKEVDTVKLYIHLFRPSDYDETQTYSAIMFIHGGGWVEGKSKAFYRQSMYFASRGMITMSIDYRIKNVHGTTPFDATQDVHDAYLFLLDHAKEWRIDKKKIVVGGGSAGGHLATTTVFWGKKTRKPLALLLFNPVLDTSPTGFGNKYMEGRYMELSPIDNIVKNQPPSIILVGTKDKVLPVETAMKYKRLAEEKGSECRVVLYDGQEHAFFSRKPVKYFVDTTEQCDYFLQELGVLVGSATIQQQYGEDNLEPDIF